MGEEQKRDSRRGVKLHRYTPSERAKILEYASAKSVTDAATKFAKALRAQLP